MKASVIRTALNIIEGSGIFKISCREWRAKQTNDKKVSLFYKYFRTADKEYRRETTAQRRGGAITQHKSSTANRTSKWDILTLHTYHYICINSWPSPISKLYPYLSTPNTCITTTTAFTATVAEAVSITPSESSYYTPEAFVTTVAEDAYTPTNIGGNHNPVKKSRRT